MITEGIKSKKKINRLSLSPVLGKEGLFVGTKSDGTSYSVRKDRHRYFFPEEWIRFINVIKSDKQLLFETLLQSGGRIEEGINIRPRDFDFERNTLTLYVTKSKATKGQTKEMGGNKRGFQVSTNYIKQVKAYIRKKGISNEGYLFPGKNGKPITTTSAWQVMKRALKKAKIEDDYNFSLHNIRKTHGMWLKSLMPYSREITEGEICMRLGHDMNTFLKHYGSPSIFNERDKNMMIKLLGDIYGLR
jgi:integrase